MHDSAGAHRVRTEAHRPMGKPSAKPKTGPPRGIKAMLKRTALGKLVKARGYTCYRRIGTNNRPTGPKLGGGVDAGFPCMPRSRALALSVDAACCLSFPACMRCVAAAADVELVNRGHDRCICEKGPARVT